MLNGSLFRLFRWSEEKKYLPSLVFVVFVLQEKAYVTGLEAANHVIQHLGEGEKASIIPIEEDEPHVKQLRTVNKGAKEILSRIPFLGASL